MTSKKYDVGSEIEAYCTKCKIDRLHAIGALKSDGNINKVVCRTCHGTHLFRRPKGEGGEKVRATRTTKRGKKGSVTLTEEDLATAKPYAMDGTYEVGDIIKHKTFGAGSVLEMRFGKMEVGFEGGGKLLVCGIVSRQSSKSSSRAVKRAASKPVVK
jgi:hypothetical protein